MDNGSTFPYRLACDDRVGDASRQARGSVGDAASKQAGLASRAKARGLGREANESWRGNPKAIESGLGCQEKPNREQDERPYRRPTQVGRGKYLEADGRSLVKELGKLTP